MKKKAMGIFSRIFSNRREPLFRPLSQVSRVVDENGDPQVKRHLDGSETLSKVEYRDQLLSEMIVADDLKNEGVNAQNIDLNGRDGCIECEKFGHSCWIVVVCSRVPALPQKPITRLSKILTDAKVAQARVFLASVELMPLGPDEETGLDCFFVKYMGLEEIETV